MALCSVRKRLLAGRKIIRCNFVYPVIWRFYNKPCHLCFTQKFLKAEVKKENCRFPSQFGQVGKKKEDSKY